MAGGLVGLLDDVVTLAKLAATSLDDIGAAAGRATSKAAGVVIDDAAVTPQYVHGLAANRELPIIKKIAKGSFRNKLLFVVPVLLILSELLPVLLTPLLMLGGGYLCYEAVHKIWGVVAGHEGGHDSAEEMKSEDEVVSGAIRTDLILSAEIMTIALNEVADEPLVSRGLILVVVAIGITILIYGVVALLVRMDDVGLHLAETRQNGMARFGRGLVNAMPKILSALGIIGTAAMLWVGGHIVLIGLDELGLHGPYDLVHGWEEAIHDAVEGLGGFLAWLTNTAASAVLGLVVGAVLVAVLSLRPGADSGASAH
ncbi:Membrane protein, putative [Euzebya pacifica]|uniref:Membrane protein, putative n=1 Tax=Euzebya pacifica TaxID=1608957 RepID=A0A346XYT4_9ACTN|nr:DUF808 domain-containing protein [Euzebya pacifica]AXV07381.1 Membrane protein, putative [Euzebya pacifica]